MIIGALKAIIKFLFTGRSEPNYVLDSQESIRNLQEIQTRMNSSTENYLLESQMELIRGRRELDRNRDISRKQSIEFIKNMIQDNNIPISQKNYERLNDLSTSQIIIVNNKLIDMLSECQEENLPALVW